ncbi:MAG TPA: TetR/AcrR family transcriptional regulator [Nakamurella multipartita]|nr:TetR/AcrR family transcriptional regulator [Nakamurella multipartita]
MTPSGPQPTTARRSDLLDALTGIFLAEGFMSLTLDQLTERLRCSKSTLYTLAPSKEQLARAVIVHYFRRSAAAVEATVSAVDGYVEEYLTSVAEELQPAQPAFYRDLDLFPPGREVYEQNVRFAAQRVQELIAKGVAAGVYRPVNSEFVADLVANALARIGRGDVARATGIDDSQAFALLSDIVMGGLRTRTR